MWLVAFTLLSEPTDRTGHGRRADSGSGLLGAPNAELVAVRIGQHDPADLALTQVGLGRAEGEQAVDLRLLVTLDGWGEVEL